MFKSKNRLVYLFLKNLTLKTENHKLNLNVKNKQLSENLSIFKKVMIFKRRLVITQ